MKPSSPGFVEAQIGLDYPQKYFSKGGERINGRTPMMIMVIMLQDKWPWTGITLPPVDSFLKDRSRMSPGDKMLTSLDITQSPDSELDSASITSVSVSKASTTREEQNRDQDGTFDCHLNRKITLSKFNDDSRTNDLWICLTDAYQYVNSGCSMSALENEIDRSLSSGFWGV